MPHRDDHNPDQFVTASSLVRNFGAWQERASRTPVYVMHRGRPRLVLTGVELMRELCAPVHGRDQWLAQRDVLLDALGEMVVLLDTDLHVTFANRAARVQMLASGSPDTTTLATLFGDVLADFLATIVRRVADGGQAEQVQLAPGNAAGAMLAITVQQLGDGIAVIARDTTAEEMRDAARAASDALDDALGMIEGVARVQIGLRGFLHAPGPSIARMTRLSPELLTSVRFVGLLDIGSRVAVGAAIEQVLVRGTATGIQARLLVNGDDPISVRIGLSPITNRLSVTGAKAVLVA